jgi:hypothetical protein
MVVEGKLLMLLILGSEYFYRIAYENKQAGDQNI